MSISPSNSNTSATSSADTRESLLERALAEHESPLVSYAETLTRQPDSAREIACEAFLQLARQNPSRIGDGAKAWLFSHCRKSALKIAPKEPKAPPAEDLRWKRIAGPEQATAEASQPAILRFIGQFPADQRELLLLKFQYGLSYPEIHTVTGLPTPAISSLIHTGLKRLRQLLDDDSTPV